MIMRKDVPTEETWDLSLLYASEKDLLSDAERMKELAETIEKKYKGKLNTPEAIDACLDLYRELYTLSVLTGNYCELAVSVDYYDTHNQDLNERILRLDSQLMSRVSFIRTEICAQDEETLMKARELATANRGYLEDLIRSKPHTLSPETEQVLAALSQSRMVPMQIYNMAKLADMKFPPFTVDGKEYPLGYSLFEDNYEYERDAKVRRAAFAAFSAKLREYENVTAAA